MAGLSNGKKPGRLARTLPGSTLDLVKGGWRIWPLAHLITYTAIPLQHRWSASVLALLCSIGFELRLINRDQLNVRG